MNRINVTKSFLPPINEYTRQLDRIWASGQLTNGGQLLQEFELKVKKYLGVDNFQFLSNGTTSLQLALRALEITEGEIITTPFSYVATTSAILWERCEPVFVDIEPETFCIDTSKIENSITPRTRAILAVHVFGFPCDVEAIEEIAQRHKLKIIYDAAHAFGVKYKNKSLLAYGDVSTCSFHATKLFHTIEGGALITKTKDDDAKVELIKRFGHQDDKHFTLGINAKVSEFHAAMGLCCLIHVDDIIKSRKRIYELYNRLLANAKLKTPIVSSEIEYNYSYYPVVFNSEEKLLAVMAKLQKSNIFPRRYFYPSLNKLPYILNKQNCPISEDISTRILCLPIYESIEESTVRNICRLLTV